MATPQGDFTQTVDYSDYKEVNGVKFPQVLEQSMGPQKIKMEATSVEVNSELSKNIFDVN